MFYRTQSGKVAKRIFRTKAEVLDIIDNSADPGGTGTMTLEQAIDSVNAHHESGISGALVHGIGWIKKASAAIAEELPLGGLAVRTETAMQRMLARKLKYDEWLANQDDLEQEYEVQVAEEKIAARDAKKADESLAEAQVEAIASRTAEKLQAGTITKAQARRIQQAPTLAIAEATIQKAERINVKAAEREEKKADDRSKKEADAEQKKSAVALAEEEAKKSDLTAKEQNDLMRLENSKDMHAKHVADQERGWGHSSEEIVKTSFLHGLGRGAGHEAAREGIPALLKWGMGLLGKRAETGIVQGTPTSTVVEKLNVAQATFQRITTTVAQQQSDASVVYEKWLSTLEAQSFHRVRNTGEAKINADAIKRAMKELMKQATEGARTGTSPSELDNRITKSFNLWISRGKD